MNRVAIIGLGLIGGSLGIDLRRKRLARAVVGWSRRRQTLGDAKRLGAIDHGTLALREAVREADVVVLATPVEAIVPLARQVLPFMRPGSVLTDVGSAKGQIVSALERLDHPAASFVGSHPLAGSERRGIGAACAGLFERSGCVVTATRRTDPQALRTVIRFWRPLVAHVLVMDPARHDRLLAAVSHLPHLVAFSLMTATEDQAFALAPRSFLDATRVAKSDPDLWDDIFLSNRAALLAAIDRFDLRWRRVRAQLVRADRRALRRFLRQAQAIRQALPDE